LNLKLPWLDLCGAGNRGKQPNEWREGRRRKEKGKPHEDVEAVGLLGDYRPLRDILMKVVKEVVRAGTQRRDANDYGFPGLNRPFSVETETLKFDRFPARIYDFDLDRPASWHS
jgi:hypothetical protein